MSLVGEERKQVILNMINDAGKVRTNDLVRTLQVSSETIRRYLEELEEDNRLKRVYGGAVKMTLEREELPHGKREVLRAEEKRRIGRAAANLVEDNDVVVIDDGSTTQQMIQFLMYKKNLTVLTNSVPGLNLLIEYTNKELFGGEVFFLGGKIDAKHYRTCGSLTGSMMSSFYVNKAFLSIDGLHPRRGITSYDADRANLSRVFMEHAKQNIILTDSSKLGDTKLYKMAAIKEIDTIISDVPVPSEWAEELKDLDVEWITAE
ncbi:DeoR/GlpR family DNA-binding transcription regulator [Paenibacillus tuaregi]|uniref:DeoR/GlpR family DNA-binding transcription regulator n=1 Tax=Paenibacillus tuaregi TaxID=1816681 RepID=UPI0008397A1F|nr:DeoR/GlpR family DNA-binding transcription regulator [Paenibacillus tuaregi]